MALEPCDVFYLAPDPDFEGYKKWIVERPESVRKLAEEFPIGTVVKTKHDEKEFFVMGWTENDQLIITPIWIWVDYHKAYSQKDFICVKHIRDGDVEVKRYKGN